MENDVHEDEELTDEDLTDEELTDEDLTDEGYYGLEGPVLYRACRDYQNTDKAIKCGAKPGTEEAKRYVEQHIASGNKYPSRFISTTASYEVALKYAEKPNYKSIIKIYLSRMTGMKALDEMINLTDTEVREHFIKGVTHRNYAKSSKEVLFQWRIPKKNASGENVFELWTKGMVSWQMMRNAWVYNVRICRKLNELGCNPEFSFTITQLQDELFHVCITIEQYLDIKHEMEQFMLVKLPDVPTQELFPGGAREKKSFTNADHLRQFCKADLVERNKPIIKRKYEEARAHVTKFKNAFNTKDKKDILAFDIDVYEHDHSKVLEIGYVVVRFSAEKNHTDDLPYLEVTCRKHLIIEENRCCSNGEICPDNRDGFVFGESKIVSLADAVERLCRDIRTCDYILGHTTKNNDAYLRKTCIDLSYFNKEMFDTHVMETYWKKRLPESGEYMRCLPYLLREYKLNFEESHLHNAGCDAFYNMMVLLRQMEYSAEKVNTIIQYYHE